MTYEIRQRMFSFGDCYTIKDEKGEDRYRVRGEVFSFGHKLTIEDLAQNRLAYIEQKLFKFLPEYDIYIDNKLSATVKKEFTVFTPKFNIESDLGSYLMKGEILSHEFEILKNGELVAKVSKQWFSLSDTYGADISDSENQAFMLSLVIIIDEVLYDNRKKQ